MWVHGKIGKLRFARGTFTAVHIYKIWNGVIRVPQAWLSTLQRNHKSVYKRTAFPFLKLWNNKKNEMCVYSVNKTYEGVNCSRKQNISSKEFRNGDYHIVHDSVGHKFWLIMKRNGLRNGECWSERDLASTRKGQKEFFLENARKVKYVDQECLLFNVYH